jgi:hypothetical protein
MALTVQLKRRLPESASPSGAPSALLSGELAWNMKDAGTGIIYGGYGNSGGNATSVVAIAGHKALPLDGASNVSTTSPANGQALVYNGTSWTNSNVGTLTSVALSLPSIFTVTGSPISASTGTTSGTLTAALASQSANLVFAGPSTGSAAPAFRALVASDLPTHTASLISDFNTAVRTNRLDQMAVPTAAVSMNSQNLTNLANPVNDQDAATKAYVDAARAGLDVKKSVRAASTTNIATLSGPMTIDGVSLVAGDRVLIKDQTTGSANGIYVVNAAAWTRATDADGSNIAGTEVSPGMFTFVEEGTVNADSAWVLTNNGAVTVGTTALTFAQFSGAGQITAGAGMTKSGNTLDVGTASSARIVVNADNIDLATVTQTNTTGTAGISFIQSHTIDTYGRTSATVTADVRSATTGQTGIVQLNDTTSSTSTSLAATANSVKVAWDLANAALARSGGTMTGKLNLVSATASLVSANIGAGTADPTTLVAGDFWVNSGAIKYHNGTAAKTLAFLDSTITGNAANVTGIVSGTNGGTGVNNGARTITIGGNLTTAGAFTTSGAFASTFTFTAATSVTFPVSGTLYSDSTTNLNTVRDWTSNQITLAGALPQATSGFITKTGTTSYGTVASTGTGSVVLADSPALTGSATAVNLSISGTLTVPTSANFLIDCGTF